MNVDGREQAADADEVVHVVDVVGVPVVPADASEKRVLDADLFVLLLVPAQLLVNIAGATGGGILS